MDETLRALLELIEKDLSVLNKQNDCLLANGKIQTALLEKQVRLQVEQNEKMAELIELAKGGEIK